MVIIHSANWMQIIAISFIAILRGQWAIRKLIRRKLTSVSLLSPQRGSAKTGLVGSESQNQFMMHVIAIGSIVFLGGPMGHSKAEKAKTHKRIVAIASKM